MPYQAVKSEYIIAPTDGNLSAVLENPHVVLNDIRSLFSVLWQSSGNQQEQEEIRGFFKWYATNTIYKLTNIDEEMRLKSPTSHYQTP